MPNPDRWVERQQNASRRWFRSSLRLSGVGVDGDTVTIAGITYHFNNGTAAPEGSVDVDITGGQTAQLTLAALFDAVEANTEQTGVRPFYFSDHLVLASPAGFLCSGSLTNGTIEGTALIGEEGGFRETRFLIVQRMVTSGEASEGLVEMVFGNKILTWDSRLRDGNDGAPIAWDGSTTVTQSRLVQFKNDGVTDFVAGNIITFAVEVET